MEPTLVRPPMQLRSGLLAPLLLAILVAGTIVFLWAAPSASEIYLTVHIAAAVVWVGGGAALTLFALLTVRAHDPHALANLFVQAEKIAQRVFAPASLVTLAFGFAVVEKDGWSYGSFWIDFALVVWALSFVLGSLLITPRAGRLRRLIDERGVGDPMVGRAMDQMLWLARVDTVMLLLVVIDMAAKPSF